MAAPISTTYSDAQRAEGIQFVLDQVAAGASVAMAIRRGRAAGLCVPSKAVFWSWHRDSPELQDRLARARQNGVEAGLDEALDIVDGNDLERDDDGALANPEHAYLMDTNRAKARAHIRLKRAEMIAPRKYGPKLDVTTDGVALGGNAPADDAEKIITILDSVSKRLGESAPAVVEPSETLRHLLS